MLRRAARALGALHLERAAAGGSLGCQASSEHSAPDAAPASQPSCSPWASASYSTDAAAGGVAFRNNPYKNNPAYVPWTPSKDLIKRKTYQKRMRHLVQTLEQEQVQQALGHKKFPEFRAGDILELRMVSCRLRPAAAAAAAACRGWSETARGAEGAREPPEQRPQPQRAAGAQPAGLLVQPA